MVACPCVSVGDGVCLKLYNNRSFDRFLAAVEGELSGVGGRFGWGRATLNHRWYDIAEINFAASIEIYLASEWSNRRLFKLEQMRHKLHNFCAIVFSNFRSCTSRLLA